MDPLNLAGCAAVAGRKAAPRLPHSKRFPENTSADKKSGSCKGGPAC